MRSSPVHIPSHHITSQTRNKQAGGYVAIKNVIAFLYDVTLQYVVDHVLPLYRPPLPHASRIGDQSRIVY